MHRPKNATKRSKGITLVELLVVIAVVAILASILVPQVVGVGAATERSLAQRNLNKLNAAVGAFGQSDQLLSDLVSSEQTEKEEAVLALLYRYDPLAPMPGSPFLDPAQVFLVTSATNRFRARWSGAVFEWIERGTAGRGVDLE